MKRPEQGLQVYNREYMQDNHRRWKGVEQKEGGAGQAAENIKISCLESGCIELGV